MRAAEPTAAVPVRPSTATPTEQAAAAVHVAASARALGRCR